MKLTRLLIKNFRGARYIEVVPVHPVTKIAAENAGGKTSALDGLTALLGGARAHGKQPVLAGEKQSDLLAEFDGGAAKGGVTVKKVIEADGGYKLEVYDKSGKVEKQQTFIDLLVGKGLALDVEAYLRMEPDKRLELTRKLVGLDFRPIDAQIAQLDSERADAGRDIHGRQTQLDAMPEHADAPAEEVTPTLAQPVLADPAALTAKLAQAQEHNRGKSALQRTCCNLTDQLRDTATAITTAHAKIKEWQDYLTIKESQHAALMASANEAEAAVASFVEIDCTPIHAEIDGIEATNRAALADAKDANERAIADANTVNAKVRANRAKATTLVAFERAKAEYERLDDEIKELGQEKARMLRAAKFPIEGMGFGISDITYRGVPLAECSSAERIRVTTAMAVALAPPGNSIKTILIRNGSLLDNKSVAIIEEIITDAEAQCFMEIVMRDQNDTQNADIIIVAGKSQQAAPE
jgi:hypothetical protein